MNNTPAAHAPPPYTSNASTADIAERLANARHAVVLTHAKPDGDAVGSVLALARALTANRTRATPVFCPPFPDRFLNLFDHDNPPVIAEDEAFFLTPELASADAVAVLDTGAFAQLGPAADFVRQRHDKAVIIDHHAAGDDTMAPLRHIDTTAAAACQPVARVAAIIAAHGAVNKLDPAIASPLYLGIATDTGWFKHPSVTPEVFRVAADLLEAGAAHNRLFLASEQSDPPSRLALTRRALENLRLTANDRIAIMTLSTKDFADAGASPADAGGLVDLPKTIGSIEVTALLYEPDPNTVKLSMRSKAGNLDIDVNAIAHQWGGGGHQHAAGAKLPPPLEDAAEAVHASITHAIDNADAEPANTP